MKDKLLKSIQRKSWLLLALFFISSCSNEDIVKHPVITNKYDPSKPQALTDFIPEKGGIGDKIIVQGNFGTDLSKMKVFFADTKEANIISSDGTSIYCTVPKQPGGNNSVKVIVDDKELTIDKTFAYTQVQKVSTVCGTYNKRGDTDGNIYDALFNNVFAVGIVAGDNIVAVESDKQRVRLISESENLVTTLISGFKAGKPAINKNRDKMYFIDVKSAKVYILRRENSWQPELLREGITELSANSGETWSCVIDDEEKYLYTRNHLGIFVRINLTEKDDSGQYKVEKLLEHRWDFEAWVSDHCSYLAYSRVEDCFYFAEDRTHAVYRIKQNADGTWSDERYAGNGWPNQTNTEGYREDIQFAWPNGVTVDNEGNIYVVNAGGQSIRKISYPDGYVTIAAGGTMSGETETDGLPLECTFLYPKDIAMDSEENFYIAGGAGLNVRKLAIE